MLFQLKGIVSWWEEIGTDGCKESREISEDFEAKDTKTAITEAKRKARGIISQYGRKFQGINLELRKFKLICKIEAIPQRVKKNTVQEVTEKKISVMTF